MSVREREKEREREREREREIKGSEGEDLLHSAVTLHQTLEETEIKTPSGAHTQLKCFSASVWMEGDGDVELTQSPETLTEDDVCVIQDTWRPVNENRENAGVAVLIRYAFLSYLHTSIIHKNYHVITVIVCTCSIVLYLCYTQVFWAWTIVTPWYFGHL